MSLIAESIGAMAAVIGTICWLPQAIKTVREKQTAGISLTTNLMILATVTLWTVYGLMIGSWPIITANFVTFCLVGAIVYVKLSVDGWRL
jgi:MtN3 and saliva related transmembrane protein